MLIVPDKQKLVLATPRYQDIQQAIPHAKVFDHDGQRLVAVHHGPEEALVLRNLGFRKTPAPILSYYKWPGRVSAMSHQKETSAFLTLNRRALVLNAPGCVDANTEYLSPTGWVRIAEYSGGEVAQFNPHTGSVEFVSAEYVKLPCTDMYRIKTAYGIDQLVSPEHRCLIYDKRNTARREVLSAEEWYRRDAACAAGVRMARSRNKIAANNAAVRTTFHYDGPGLALSDNLLRVQVAVIADGHFPSATSRCLVRVKKDRKKTRLRELLANAHITYTERTVDYPSAQGFTVFSFYAPMRTKVFGAEFFAASQRQLQVIADEAMYWDSNISPNPNRGWRFSTYEKASADFIQFALSATGTTARVLVAKRERRGRVETEYCVFARSGTQYVGARGGSSGSTVSPARSTDGFKYCFMVPSTFLVLRRNGCVFTTGNTGKSLSALWAADYLLSEKAVRKVLIVCPLSTVKTVWGKELRHHFPSRSFEMLVGTKEQRLRRLETKGLQYAIINHDGFSTISDKLTDFDLVIYDEATALKSPSAQRFRTFYRWTQTNNCWLWLMTGTPISQSPVDAWTLARLVNSPHVPNSFNAFRESVLEKVGTFRWIPRPNALETCQKVLTPSIRFSLDECKDLPDTVFLDHECALTQEQAKSFREMRERAVLIAHDVTAPNAAIVMSKLIQICAGVVYATDGERVKLDSSDRYDVFKEVLSEIGIEGGSKVVVFVPLRGVQDALYGQLRTDGYDVACVHGDVTGADRDAIFREFQEGAGHRVLLAHPKVAAHGLTLTRARDVVWYSPIYSLEMYEQANARIRRLTTEGRTRVHHLYATSFEKELYRRLQYKKQVLSDFLDLVKGKNEGE